MSKAYRLYSFIIFLFAVVVSVHGFSLIKKSGEVLHYAPDQGDWIAAGDSTECTYSDSIFLDSSGEATLRLSAAAKLLLKGTTRISIDGEGLGPVIFLVQGQAFLVREQPYELNSIVVSAKGCKISPIGTAAAIKYTSSGEPTVACIRGKVRMEAPSGEAILVGPRKYGTFNPVDAAFSQGDLSEKAVAALESWSGKTAAPAETTASSAEQAAEPAEKAAAGDGSETPQETAAGADESPAEETAETPGEDAAQEEEAPAATASGTAPPPGAKQKEKPEQEDKKEEKEKKDKAPDKPSFGLSAGPVTVGDEMWTRVAFLADIPIWKFGIGLDVELFINSDGKFDQKGWEFDEDNWAKSLLRKIRYIRFNKQNDPVFIKFGGLDNVTLSYGLVVDRFNNTLHYPDERLIGLQFYLNNLSPIGISLQTVVADFYDFKNDGGVLGGRFAIKPLKPTDIPIVKGIDVGALYFTDMNQFAPAREWDYTLEGPEDDLDEDGITDLDYRIRDHVLTYGDSLTQQQIDNAKASGRADTLIEHRDQWASDAENAYSILGFDLTVPIITTKLINLAVYGQYGMGIDDHKDSRYDNVETTGWGIGAPGVSLNAGPVSARLEYRHTSGDFMPGYFGPYYYDERIRRETINDSSMISVKEGDIIAQDLNGVYGSAGFNIANVIMIGATYQYLLGKADAGGDKDPLDHRFEVNGGIGDLLISKIPKLYKAEAYLYKTSILRNLNPYTGEYDNFFSPCPAMYYGYRLGFEIMPGAGIIWDARYGFEYEPDGDVVQTPSNVSIQANMVF
ncbi:MAG: hypothetical protein GF350_12895 [Chitinivibrionales bacterium]|nr:hypothetical protein [Chitinivibrionales bacterium]